MIIAYIRRLLHFLLRKHIRNYCTRALQRYIQPNNNTLKEQQSHSQIPAQTGNGTVATHRGITDAGEGIKRRGNGRVVLSGSQRWLLGSVGAEEHLAGLVLQLQDIVVGLVGVAEQHAVVLELNFVKAVLFPLLVDGLGKAFVFIASCNVRLLGQKAEEGGREGGREGREGGREGREGGSEGGREGREGGREGGRGRGGREGGREGESEGGREGGEGAREGGERGSEGERGGSEGGRREGREGGEGGREASTSVVKPLLCTY